MTRPPARDHAADGVVTMTAPDGLPEFGPGADLAAAIATACELCDGDILVITSKVVSKIEGRVAPAPADPDERDRLRRRYVDDETVRVLARHGRTLITENRLGIVQAAAGVDSSNIGADEIALLPRDPDASAARLRERLWELTDVRLGVIVTDTMGRAWRTGQTDVAIGASGVRVRIDHSGAPDHRGMPLRHTDIAVGDELAAAADLVKGKRRGRPVAVIRGLAHLVEGAGAAGIVTDTGRDLLRPLAEDLFREGTDAAYERGRRDAREEMSDEDMRRTPPPTYPGACDSSPR